MSKLSRWIFRILSVLLILCTWYLYKYYDKTQKYEIGEVLTFLLFY